MIRKATLRDVPAAAALAALLWPGHETTELEEEFSRTIADRENAVFLALSDHEPVGFAHCSLRHDYVEGTESSPVAYLEGIFVKSSHRGRGLAKALLTACEQWGREQGCGEFASDCELDNTESILFHAKLGFTEANRIVCFQKKL